VVTAIRVLVADDQAIVRDGLVTILSLLPDIVVVGEAVDGLEAVELVEREQPHVVLMDLRMPRLDGAAATARIVAAHPRTAVLVLTTFADDDSIASALRAGAIGYLTKDAGRAELEAAIRSAAAGQSTLGRGIGSRVLAGFAAPAERSAAGVDAATLRGRFPDLTAREADVLALLAVGRSNPEIAAELFVSVATVKSHINAVFAKIGARDRAAAMALALRL
jgi:DNA-binding NarL/FixJ family response regulator